MVLQHITQGIFPVRAASVPSAVRFSFVRAVVLRLSRLGCSGVYARVRPRVRSPSSRASASCRVSCRGVEHVRAPASCSGWAGEPLQQPLESGVLAARAVLRPSTDAKIAMA